VHELLAEAVAQLELLVMRAPPALRFVLATRWDLRLGLHQLGLEGELVEVRSSQASQRRQFGRLLRSVPPGRAEEAGGAGLRLWDPAGLFAFRR